MSNKSRRRSLDGSQIKTKFISLAVVAGTKAQTFVDADVTVVGDIIDDAGHGFVSGDRVQMTTSGVLPAGLALTTDYWVILINADQYKVASSLANALAGTAVDITAAAGGGTHTVTATDKMTGLDSLQGSLQVQATGTYRYTFAEAFLNAEDFDGHVTPITSDVVCRVKAKNVAYIDIEVQDLDETPAILDGSFSLLVIGSETSSRW